MGMFAAGTVGYGCLRHHTLRLALTSKAVRPSEKKMANILRLPLPIPFPAMTSRIQQPRKAALSGNAGRIGR